ncbi:hypothetical protein Tco_1209130, partial [Tanacetum coccineum]
VTVICRQYGLFVIVSDALHGLCRIFHVDVDVLCILEAKVLDTSSTVNVALGVLNFHMFVSTSLVLVPITFEFVDVQLATLGREFVNKGFLNERKESEDFINYMCRYGVPEFFALSS